mgnify:FL=1|jgi:aromatic-L-amino-acid/L-tryptophan decarboxylase
MGDSTFTATHSLEEWRRQSHAMIDFVYDYHASLADGTNPLPVRSAMEQGYLRSRLPSEAPDLPESFESILVDVQQHIMPGITHWQHPSFFAYFSANFSPPALNADILSDALGVIGFSWLSSPACTELELIVLDWLIPALGLPPAFLSTSSAGGGCIQSTASDATLVALLAARSHLLRRHDCSSMDELRMKRTRKMEGGGGCDLVMYCSDQAHSSVAKAGMIAGLHPLGLLPGVSSPSLHLVPSADDGTMQIDALQQALATDVSEGKLPFLIVSTIGTTSTGAVDDLQGINALAQDYNLWHHVDAAWAGTALLLPELRDALQGPSLAGVQSFAFNPHKWMLTNFDCSVLYTQERISLVHALTLQPEYLKNAQDWTATENAAPVMPDLKDWQIPLGRRFRALKLWMVLRQFGLKGLREHVRRGIDEARTIATYLRQQADFTVTQQNLSLVVFRWRKSDNANIALLNAVNMAGKAFLIHSKDRHGQVILRIATGGVHTTQQHCDSLCQEIRLHADQLSANYIH